MSYRANSQKARLLACFAEAGSQGMTDDEAAIAADLVRSCFWKRCGELRQDGMVADCGRLRPGPLFGEMRMVSVITAEGMRTVSAFTVSGTRAMGEVA